MKFEKFFLQNGALFIILTAVFAAAFVLALGPHSTSGYAVFDVENIEYTVTVQKTGLGGGIVIGDSISCGADCTSVAISNTALNFTTIADTGSQFAGWNGDCQGTNPSCTVIVSDDIVVGAEFADIQAPSVPGGLGAEESSQRQINISWNESTDNIGVTGYRVYRDGAQIATTGQTGYIDSGLSLGTTYAYTVAAYDASGNLSLNSQPTTITTSSLPPNGVDLANGIVAYWQLNDAAGNTAFDSSGNSNTLSLTNSPAWVAGKAGGALSFNGTTNFASSPDIALGGTNKVALSFWMRKSTFTPLAAIGELTPNTNENTTGFGIYQSDTPTCLSGQIEISIKGNAGHNIKCYSNPGTAWHHYTIILDKGQNAANEITLYIDGALRAPRAQPSANDNSNNFSDSPIYLMSRGGTSLFSAGILDDVRVYGRVLSASEIKSIYTSNLPPGVGLQAAGAPNYTYIAPATIPLSAAAYDPDGNVINVQFYRGTSRIATDKIAPYEFNWTKVAGGIYAVRALAVDNKNASTFSAPITVTVNLNGTCGTSRNSCAMGKFFDLNDTLTDYLWQCTGSFGGTTASCTYPKPIKGVCGTDVNSCAAGTFKDNTDSTTYNYWYCMGLYRGANDSCRTLK